MSCRGLLTKCNVFERIIRKHIVEHLTQHDLLSAHQHGFVMKRSYQTSLMESIEDWTTIMDQGCGMEIVYLDFQKAFDSLPHQRPGRKLRSYGLDGNLLAWISDRS